MLRAHHRVDRDVVAAGAAQAHDVPVPDHPRLRGRDDGQPPVRPAAGHHPRRVAVEHQGVVEDQGVVEEQGGVRAAAAEAPAAGEGELPGAVRDEPAGRGEDAAADRVRGAGDQLRGDRRLEPRQERRAVADGDRPPRGAVRAGEFLEHLDDRGGRQLQPAGHARGRQPEEPGRARPLDQVAGQGLELLGFGGPRVQLRREVPRGGDGVGSWRRLRRCSGRRGTRAPRCPRWRRRRVSRCRPPTRRSRTRRRCSRPSST